MKPIRESERLEEQQQHDRNDETFVVGIQTRGYDPVSWQLRVAGRVHGEGVAAYASVALRDAADALDEASENAVATTRESN